MDVTLLCLHEGIEEMLYGAWRRGSSVGIVEDLMAAPVIFTGGRSRNPIIGIIHRDNGIRPAVLLLALAGERDFKQHVFFVNDGVLVAYTFGVVNAGND